MALYPENTLRSILGALRGSCPAAGVEFDVRLTADGCPVLFHDDQTLSLTGKPGTVEERTLGELRDLRVSGETIPTLAEVVNALKQEADEQSRDLLVNVELKPTGAPEPLIRACADLLDTLEADERIALVVSSFDPRVLKAASEPEYSWRLALIYEDEEALAFLPLLEEERVLDLHPRYDLVNPEHMAFAGVRAVRTWTVNELDVAIACIDLGVEAIISNDPSALITALSPEDTP